MDFVELSVPSDGNHHRDTEAESEPAPEPGPARPEGRLARCLTTGLSAALFAALAACEGPGSVVDLEPHRAPAGSDTAAIPSAEIFDPPWLDGRGGAQIEALEETGVYHDFRLADSLVGSGVDFVHRQTDETGRDWKGIHYDHANSVSVADVDGDGLLDLYFTNQIGANRLYRNVGNGRFEDVTEEAGVALPGRISVAGSFADTDNDGDPDLFVTVVRDGNVFLENRGDGTYRDATEQSGLGARGHYSASVFFDYDRDGLLDLFVTNVGIYTEPEKREHIGFSHEEESPQDSIYAGVDRAFQGHVLPGRNQPSILYRNTGDNRFRDVTQEMGIAADVPWTGDATPLDYNDDGWPDLYALNMQGHDVFYENVQGERFRNVTREVFPNTPWGAMGIKAFDFENDGDQDLFLTDMHSDMSQTVEPSAEKEKSDMQWSEEILRSEGRSIFGNAFFRNDGGGRFTEISQEIGAENFWPWGISVGDLNADGFTDVFIASGMSYPYRYGINTVLLNRRGEEFVDSEFALGVEPRRGGRTAKPWFVLDCAGGERWHRHCRPEGRSELSTVWSATSSRSSVIFDLDEDGDLDLVTSEFHDVPLLLVSDLTERKQDLRYLKVRLVGSASNRDGLGTRVEVSAAGRTLTRVHDGQSGYLAQSSKPLYFGLGDARSVDRIELTWPSGRTQVVEGPVETNQLLTIREPAEEDG